MFLAPPFTRPACSRYFCKAAALLKHSSRDERAVGDDEAGQLSAAVNQVLAIPDAFAHDTRMRFGRARANDATASKALNKIAPAAITSFG